MNKIKAIDLHRALGRVLRDPHLSADSEKWRGRCLQVPVFSEPNLFLGDHAEISHKAELVILLQSVEYCENGVCRYEWALDI